jgi:hypothetical protein
MAQIQFIAGDHLRIDTIALIPMNAGPKVTAAENGAKAALAKQHHADIPRGAETTGVSGARRNSFANDHLLPVGRRRVASG